MLNAPSPIIEITVVQKWNPSLLKEDWYA